MADDQCKIELEGLWYSRSAMLWLGRSSSTSRVTGKSCLPTSARDAEQVEVEIAPNMGVAPVMTTSCVMDEEVKKQ